MIFNCRLLDSIPGELAKTEDALAAATDRFVEVLEKDAAHAAVRHDPIGAPPIRIPQAPARRPRPHPAALPAQHRRGTPATFLNRERRREAERRGGPPPLAAAIEGGAERAAGALRDELRALQRGLGHLQQRLGRRSR